MKMDRRRFFVIVIVIAGFFIDLTSLQSKLHPRNYTSLQMDEFSPRLPILLVRDIIVVVLLELDTNIVWSILTWSIGIKTPYEI